MANDHSHPSTWSEEGLRNLLARLEQQSLKPDFQIQRQRALSLALQPYLDPLMNPPLFPLAEEEELAKWLLYADYVPDDGHFSLIEQVRDLVTEHVPEEERVWLDSFRHSYMDLLKVRDVSPGNQAVHARLQSLGDQQMFEVLLPVTPVAYKIGNVHLTRIIRGLSEARLPGPPLVLSATMGKAVFESANEMRRDIEIETGNFALSEWAEFAKSYGHMMLWSVAKVRQGSWAVVDSHIDYRNTRGETFLYALALYEHHEFPMLVERLHELEHFTPVKEKRGKAAPPGSGTKALSWVWCPPQEQSGDKQSPIARLTLTSTQLFLETDSPNRLDTVKHQLASIFGFSLHFRGETSAPPLHTTPEIDLLSDSYSASPTVVSQEEEQQILASFLETGYLKWAEMPSPALKDQSPRHYCATQQDSTEVAAIIDQMEQHDLGRRRTGQSAYDYNLLRGHIGL